MPSLFYIKLAFGTLYFDYISKESKGKLPGGKAHILMLIYLVRVGNNCQRETQFGLHVEITRLAK